MNNNNFTYALFTDAYITSAINIYDFIIDRDMTRTTT